MMTQEDLSAAVANLISLQARDEKVLGNVWEAVGWNAGLANAVVTRVNAMESAFTLATGQLKDQGNEVAQLRADVAGHGGQITQMRDDTLKALELVHNEPISRDAQLRREMDA